MTFREDLAAASDWAATYLRDDGRAAGGESRPAGGRPEAASDGAARKSGAVFRGPARYRRGDRSRADALEPPALLRLLRDHGLRAGHPRRAPDRGVERQRDALAHLAGRDRARAGDARLARPAARPSRGPPRAHRGHGVDVDARGARRRADACGPAASSTPPSTPTSRSRRRAAARARVGKVRVDDEFRMLADFSLADATAVVATVGTTSTTSVDPCASSPPLRGRRRLAPRRRGVRGLRGRLPRVPLVPRRLGASRLDRRQPAQVAVHADRLLDALDAPAGGAPRGVRGARRLPRLGAAALVDFRDYGPAARAPFPCAQALDGAPLLRPRGPAGAHPRARAPGRAVREWVDAEPGWEVSAPRLFLHRLLSPERRRQRGDRTSCDRDGRDLRRDHEAARRDGHSVRDRERLDEGRDVRRAWEVLRACAP